MTTEFNHHRASLPFCFITVTTGVFDVRTMYLPCHRVLSLEKLPHNGSSDVT